jgi:hypothetical protein
LSRSIAAPKPPFVYQFPTIDKIFFVSNCASTASCKNALEKPRKAQAALSHFSMWGLNKPRITLIPIAGYSSLCRLQRHISSANLTMKPVFKFVLLAGSRVRLIRLRPKILDVI